jgi:hypothetical protein
MLLSVLAYYVQNWRHLLWITSLPFALVFLTVP